MLCFRVFCLPREKIPGFNPDFCKSAKTMWRLEGEGFQKPSLHCWPEYVISHDLVTCKLLLCIHTSYSFPSVLRIIFFINPAIVVLSSESSSLLCVLPAAVSSQCFSLCLLPSSDIIFSLIPYLLSFGVHVVVFSALLCLLHRSLHTDYSMFPASLSSPALCVYCSALLFLEVWAH